jgi:hypothetical protein
MLWHVDGHKVHDASKDCGTLTFVSGLLDPEHEDSEVLQNTANIVLLINEAQHPRKTGISSNSAVSISVLTNSPKKLEVQYPDYSNMFKLSFLCKQIWHRRKVFSFSFFLFWSGGHQVFIAGAMCRLLNATVTAMCPSVQQCLEQWLVF